MCVCWYLVKNQMLTISCLDIFMFTDQQYDNFSAFTAKTQCLVSNMPHHKA